MRKTSSRRCLPLTLLAVVAAAASPPQPHPLPISTWSWEQVKDRFELNNPTLLADQLNIDESKAQQITAYLQPNPQLTLAADGTQIASDKGVWKPFAGTYETPTISYLQLLARTAAQAGIKTGERAERDAHFGGESRRSVEDSAL